MAISLIAIVAVMTTASVSLPAVYAKKHHHLTDTQREDSTTTDSNGRACNLGPSHDQCRDPTAAEGSEDFNDDDA